MRLWHEKLLRYLPREQLLGQHRECCALRGAGWGIKHSTVNYVFNHPREWLYCYHLKVMLEMRRRGYQPDMIWLDMAYRGKFTPSIEYTEDTLPDISELNSKLEKIVYPEHDYKYLEECINNLALKGIYLNFEESTLLLEDFEYDGD